MKSVVFLIHYCNFIFNIRLTLWLMRSSLIVPLFTAAMTASKASMKWRGPSTMSTPALILPTAASALVHPCDEGCRQGERAATLHHRESLWERYHVMEHKPIGCSPTGSKCASCTMQTCIVNFLCHRLLLLIPLAVRAAATGYPTDIAAEELVDALTLILTL